MFLAHLSWRLDMVLGQIGSKLFFAWQQRAPIDLQWGKRCLHLFSVVFYPVLFILAGNEDVHKISDEFEFRPYRTTDYGVSCPWASKTFPIDLQWENAVRARSDYSLWSYLPLNDEKFDTFELEYLWGQLASLDQILCVASLGLGEGCIGFWGWLGQKSGVHGNRKPSIDL